MLFKDAIDQLIERFPDSLDSSVNSRTKAKNALNIAISEVYRAAYWNFRKSTGQLVLIPNYTTGSVSATKYDGTNDFAAKTLSFSGANLTQNMVGRYFRVANGDNWYKIVYISGNTAYIEIPFIEDSGSYSFEIWKKFYYTGSDVDIILESYLYESGKKLNFRGNGTNNVSDVGQPYEFSPEGVDPFDDSEYSAGTISGSKNSNIITGSNTSFTGNVSRGDILIIGGREYSIKRVELDTRLILNNYIDSEIPSESTYRIRKNNPVGLQYYHNSDDYRVIEYKYLKKPYYLINEEYDYIPLDDSYLTAIFSRAEMLIRKDKDSQQWLSVANVYQLELNGLKKKRYVVEPEYMQFSPANLDKLPGRE